MDIDDSDTPCMQITSVSGPTDDRFIFKMTPMYLHRNHVIDLYAHNALSRVMSNMRGSHFAICHGTIMFGWYTVSPSPFLHEGSKERCVTKRIDYFLSFFLFPSKECILRACMYRGYSPKCARRRCTKKSITSVTMTGSIRHYKTMLVRRQFGDPSDWRSFLKSRGPVDSPNACVYSTRGRNAGDNASFFLLFFLPAGWLACNESRGWINYWFFGRISIHNYARRTYNEVIPPAFRSLLRYNTIFSTFF